MSLEDADCSPPAVKDYLTATYNVPDHRVNEALDRHSFRITEGAKYRRTAGDVGDEIAGVEKWSMKA